MGWGAIGQVVGSIIGGESGQRENHKQKRAAARYTKAERQMAAMQQRDDRALEIHNQQLSDERYGDLGDLASALRGPERGGAGDAGMADASGRLDAALGPMQSRMALNTRGAIAPGASRAWGAAADAQYAPRLASRRGLIEQEGRQRGMTNYDNAAYNRLGDEQVDVGRRSSELSRRAGLMAQYRDQILANEGSRFSYKGPSSQFYNAQLIGQLAGTAGNAVDAYSGGGGTGGYSNSTAPSNRLQGPANYP
jgi:hypothetical protein